MLTLPAGPPNYKILQDLGPSTSEGSSSNEESVENSAEEASGSGREEEDAMTAAPGSISILESCLVDWASKTRMRLKVTVRITHSPVNGEVEVEVRVCCCFAVSVDGFAWLLCNVS